MSFKFNLLFALLGVSIGILIQYWFNANNHANNLNNSYNSDDLSTDNANNVNNVNSVEIDSSSSSSSSSVCILYTGALRTFSKTFHTHLYNLIIPSPYKYVHIYLIVNSLLLPSSLSSINYTESEAIQWGKSSFDTLLFDLFQYENENNSLHPLVKIDTDLAGLIYTFQYYNSYTNIHGQNVSIISMIKGIQIRYTQFKSIQPDNIDGPQNDLSDDYNDKIIWNYLKENHNANSLINSYWATTGEYIGANFIKNYENSIMKNNYQWVFRIRPDVYLRNNLWESIYKITPIILLFDSSNNHNYNYDNYKFYVGDVGSSSAFPTNHYYLLYDQLYSPTLLNDKVYTVLSDNWEGINDQFLFGPSNYMNIYFTRWNNKLLNNWINKSPFMEEYKNQLYDNNNDHINNDNSNPNFSRESSWVFNPEIFSQQVLVYSNIPFTRISLCYGLLRNIHNPNSANSSNIYADFCSIYFVSCCYNICGSKNNNYTNFNNKNNNNYSKSIYTNHYTNYPDILNYYKNIQLIDKSLFTLLHRNVNFHFFNNETFLFQQIKNKFEINKTEIIKNHKNEIEQDYKKFQLYLKDVHNLYKQILKNNNNKKDDHYDSSLSPSSSSYFYYNYYRIPEYDFPCQYFNKNPNILKDKNNNDNQHNMNKLNMDNLESIGFNNYLYHYYPFLHINENHKIIYKFHQYQACLQKI